MKNAAVIICIIVLCFVAQNVLAHCEIPCGIYDDGMRIKLIREHIATIEKSMKMITDLTSVEEKNYNQIVRWINNKENHSNELQHIVTQYFMTQRISPMSNDKPEDREEGLNKLALLHSLLVSAMKAKQSIDLKHIADMRAIVDKFEKLYFKD
ncbi:MAG: superoxide dismutase [Ni] [Candidatus Krumholzibacteriota bacterium]|nr:superoxide dismutase [Ni] [Candidatus Krumholzibacteriota bacterium]